MAAKFPQALIPEFLSIYDAKAKDEIWKNLSAIVREFWNSRVMSPDSAPISDEDCDRVIMILDRSGKGNTPSSEAIARVMIAQGAWRRMFNLFHTDKELGFAVNSILVAASADERIKAIDHLYEINKGRKNYVTGQSGNAVGALLAGFDPLNNLSLVSLSHRKKLMNFLELDAALDVESVSVGELMVRTNEILRAGLAASGISGSARTLSCFCYTREMEALWLGRHATSVRGSAGETISINVPTKNEDDLESQTEDKSADTDIRESLQIQACLADIGAKMGLKIWLPKSDRARVLRNWSPDDGVLLDQLPIINEESVLKTVEQIDVIWLKGRSIIRAFEVEHTTSVYSGLLRMADLLALQPNLSIDLNIVAPKSRRDKVFGEILRPVFQLMEGGPLASKCAYISYESVRALREEKRLGFMSPDVISDIEERADEE